MTSIKHRYSIAVAVVLLGSLTSPVRCMNEGAHPARARAHKSLHLKFFDAERSGDVQAVRQLLRGDHGIDADAIDKTRSSCWDTPLMRAARKGNIGMVSLLLDAKADTEKSYGCEGRTPLYEAISCASFLKNEYYVAIVSMLLDAKANPNAANEDGRTPLYPAARSEDVRFVDLLVEAKAVVNVFDKFRKTPLDVASEVNNQATIEVLEGYGAVALQPEVSQEAARAVEVRGSLVCSDEEVLMCAGVRRVSKQLDESQDGHIR
jgi:hypothetical protein